MGAPFKDSQMILSLVKHKKFWSGPQFSAVKVQWKKKKEKNSALCKLQGQ